jgi:HSP20 family protein
MATSLTRSASRPEYTPVTRLPDLVDRLFQENGFGLTPRDRWTLGSAHPVNLYETTEGYLMQIALPGIKSENLDIQVMPRQVTIQGTYDISVPENSRPLWQSFQGGEFQQTYALPMEVESEQVDARYENGILTLDLPKREHLRPKSVKVSVNH